MKSFSAMAWAAWLAALLFIPDTGSVLCPVGVTEMTVTTTEDANDLVTTLDCSGGGTFDVTWVGRVVVMQTIVVSNGSALTINGINETSSIDGGDNVGLFNLSGRYQLTLRGLALQGGNAIFGGAIVAEAFDTGSGSTIDVADCLFFGNRADIDGGAIFSDGPHLYIDGTTRFTDNSAGNSGGAISSQSSSIFVSGITEFSGNSAVNGGAIHFEYSKIGIFNSTSFIGNSAEFEGGGVYVYDADITISGTTYFENNTSGDVGGGISATASNVSVHDATSFTENFAGFEGGAIYCWEATLFIFGATTFDRNFANAAGGAIFAYISDVKIDGTTTFHANVVTGGGGGGIYAYEGAIALVGDTRFTSNTGSNGGGMYLIYCKVLAENKTVFDKNQASVDGGAMYIVNPTGLRITDAAFTSNVAGSGGAVHMAAAEDRKTEFIGCNFKGNKAFDGGALYFSISMGDDAIQNSTFVGNLADYSGGALFLTGDLRMKNTTFIGNEAGQDGLAIFSIAVLEDSFNLIFANNTLHCPKGEYGYDKSADEEEFIGTCRSEFVCTRCWRSCYNAEYDASIASVDRIPVCEELPTGTKAVSNGTTVEKFYLEEGYYRTSMHSRIVRKCHQAKACVGGTKIENYCATGYNGPYCAVCAEGYAPGTKYSCHECTGASGRSSIGVFVTASVVFVFVVGVAVSGLVRVENSRPENKEEGLGAQTVWGRRFSYSRGTIVKAIPLTAVKIVVVVWQIVTQFATVAGVVFPKRYQDFLSNLAPVNLDLGYILSYSCVVKTDFYDRLLFATFGSLFTLAVLAVTYCIAKRRNRTSEEAVRIVRQRHLSVALFIAFLVYSSVSFTIFQTFVCDELDDGETFLRADYSLTCKTAVHRAYEAYAFVMIAVYPVGIPALFTWWLVRNQGHLMSSQRGAIAHLQPMNDIWAAYKPSRYYYEVIECGRRIALTGVAVFVLPESAAQIAIVLLIAVVFTFLSETMSPFEKCIDMALYRWGNGVVFASMYVALLLRVDISVEDGTTMSAFAGALIAANVFMIVAIVVQSLMLVKTRFVPRTVEVPGPNSRGTSSKFLEDVQEEDPMGNA